MKSHEKRKRIVIILVRGRRNTKQTKLVTNVHLEKKNLFFFFRLRTNSSRKGGGEGGSRRRWIRRNVDVASWNATEKGAYKGRKREGRGEACVEWKRNSWRTFSSRRKQDPSDAGFPRWPSRHARALYASFATGVLHRWSLSIRDVRGIDRSIDRSTFHHGTGTERGVEL